MKKFGHYEVTAELGRGGMGVVYKGWEPSLNRKVAIKALGEHLLKDDDLVERFTREAKATAALNDPNVIQIYYIGKEQGQPFFAMEYIEGQSLDDLLKGSRTLSVKHAKNILRQACQGLAAAHAIDLVHRDIKPANMMLTTNGTLKVVDFGIARTREYGDKLTNTGEFVGTPGYLSPEVCIGKEVDQRSDIFALGIVFYEMLAGKVPFENDSPLGLMLEVVQSEIPDIRQLNKKVDKKTAFILNKMIAKSPDDRYQNCGEVIRDLGNVIDNQPIMAIKDAAQTVTLTTAVKNNISDQATLPSAAAVTANNLMVQPQAKSQKKWPAVAAIFIIIGAAAGFGFYQGYIPFPSSNQAANQPAMIAVNTDQETMQAGFTDNTQSDQSSSDQNNNVAQHDGGTDLKAKELQSTEKAKDVAHNINNDNDALGENSIANETPTAAASGDKVAMLTEQQPLSPDALSTETGNDSITNSAADTQTVDNTLTTQALVQPVAQQLVNTSKLAHQNVKQNTTDVINNPSVKGADTRATMAQNVRQQANITTKKVAVPLNKGVVVMAFGDPAIANPVEKILEGELKQKGIKVMNEQFIPGIRQLLNNDLDLAELKNLIEKSGGQAMVIANVNYVGTQELSYAGRFSELISAQLDIDAYDIKTGDSIGDGFGTTISYTSLNATDQASDSVMQFSDKLASNLKPRI